MLTRSLKLGLAIAGLACCFGTACSSSSAHVSAHPTVLAAGEADPEIRTALGLIEKASESVTGYQNLAVIYIRRARQTGDFGLNTKAEGAIERALELDPANVSSRKLRSSLLATFHRFPEALAASTQLQQENPQDPFNYGILVDANVELGNYPEAVAAAQQMVDLRPNSSSYARVAHLRSLHGDQTGAVKMLELAARTADPADREAQSWCLVQLGDEHFKYGKFAEAKKDFDEALSILPDFHLAVSGKGRSLAAMGDLEGAIANLSSVQDRVPNVENAVLLGDLYLLTGDAEKSKQQYDLVEAIEKRMGVNADQKRLALMWADQSVRLDEALEIAVREEASRTDIFTEDVLAWCLYRSGRLSEAKAAVTKALRLKSNDARILYHAGMIEKGLGNRSEAAKLLSSALRSNPAFDLIQSKIAQEALIGLKGKG